MRYVVRDNAHESVWLLLGLLGLIAARLHGRLLVDVWQRYERQAAIALASLIMVSLPAAYVFARKRAPAMSGLEFEDYVMTWLAEAGFSDLAKTEYYDQGVDLTGIRSGWSWGIQVKYSSRPVGVAAVRAVVAGIGAYGCHKAMVVTNHSFTRPARQLAVVNNCWLVDGSLLKLHEAAVLQ